MADLITRPERPEPMELEPLADTVAERLLTTQAPQRPQSTPRIRIEVDGRVVGTERLDARSWTERTQLEANGNDEASSNKFDR
jgi:hypothetical protein